MCYIDKDSPGVYGVGGDELRGPCALVIILACPTEHPLQDWLSATSVQSTESGHTYVR